MHTAKSQGDQSKSLWLKIFSDIPKLDSEEGRKRRLFVILALPGVLTLLPVGIYNLMYDNALGGWMDIIGILALVVSCACLRIVKKPDFIFRANTLALALIVTIWCLDGGLHGEKLLWAFCFPPIALFLFGRKEGMIWNLILIGVIGLIFLAGDQFGIQVYRMPFKIRFVCAYLLLITVTYIYESSRQAYQQNLAKEQVRLRAEQKKLAQATDAMQSAHKALVKSEGLLRHAQSIAHMGNWEYNYLSGKIWCSHEGFRILGVDHSNPYLHSSQLQNIIPDFHALQHQVADTLARTTQCEVEFSAHRLSDGKKIHVYARAELVLDHGQNPAKLIGIIQDITARKEDEKEKKELQVKLARSQKMEALGLLAGGVAHDLNNVMFGMVSYPDFLMTKMDPHDAMYEPLKKICDAGQKAAAIVEDLLTLARRGVSASEVFHLNTVINEYMASPEFKKLKSYHPRVDFVIQFDEGLLNIKGSPIHLKKSVMNLVSNAAEAIREGGTVTVSTTNCYMDTPIKGYSDVMEGDYVLLKVKDTGSGIAPEDLGHIFEPFYTKKMMGRSGTGLGMAVVWGTVQDHSGYIDVQSEPGQGTVIDIYLPICRDNLNPEELDRVIGEFKGRGEQILIVDDVEDQRQIAARILEDMGYVAHTAAGGEEAVAFVRKKNVDLLVLDMIMDPGMDGLETYQRIMQFCPGQKAIIVSGFAETERVKAALRLGAGAYIKKPYVLETLGVAIREELDKG